MSNYIILIQLKNFKITIIIINESCKYKFQTTQIFVLFKSILTNQHPSVFQQTLETLELWKNLINNVNIKPKTYEFSANSKFIILISLFKKLS